MEIKHLYYERKMPMRIIAQHYNVSLDAVVYFMRKYQLPRRTLKQASSVLFEQKAPSFRLREELTPSLRELWVAGVMLYWGEGYKSDKGKGIDFANSDPCMIKVFLNFLRRIYQIDETRLRIYIYSYADQDTKKLIRFWSSITKIPLSQFSKPYVRQDFRKDGRKMKNGLIHVRYSDKKLLLELKRSIEEYKEKFTSV